MISKSEQIQLKQYLGAQYSGKVLKMLNRKGIKNKHGKPHTAAYVRMVFQGLRNNPEIENTIWELAHLKKEALYRKKKLKMHILKKE